MPYTHDSGPLTHREQDIVCHEIPTIRFVEAGAVPVSPHVERKSLGLWSKVEKGGHNRLPQLLTEPCGVEEEHIAVFQ